MSVTRISVCQVSDGTRTKWGISYSDDWGLSDGFIVGTKIQAQANADKMMKETPRNWIQIPELDGSVSYFDKDRSHLSSLKNQVPELDESIYKEPTHTLCITTDGCHAYCMKISEQIFKEKCPLFKFKFKKPLVEVE